MKSFKAYVQEANRLRSKFLEERDADQVKNKLISMQKRIQRAELTVYQKEALMQQLRSVREAEYA